MPKKNIIIGCGGHARSAISILIKNKNKNIIIKSTSKIKKNEKIYGISINKLNLDSELKKNDNFYLAIGDIKLRTKYFNLLTKEKRLLPNIISTSSNLTDKLKIGIGNFIGENSFIGPFVKIGSNNIINTNVSIDHECEIGSNCNISPGVIIAGRVKIGDNNFIGIGACISDNITIGKNITIGANTFINKSINKPGIYYGNPIKRVK
jgi:UDP-perosamine 4-acetyltransferase